MTHGLKDSDGKIKVIELIEGGGDIDLDESNKKLYIEKVCYLEMTKSIEKQLKSFLSGFYEIIPQELIKIFNYKELELLISGLPNVDVDDLRANTEYKYC